MAKAGRTAALLLLALLTALSAPPLGSAIGPGHQARPNGDDFGAGAGQGFWGMPWFGGGGGAGAADFFRGGGAPGAGAADFFGGGGGGAGAGGGGGGNGGGGGGSGFGAGWGGAGAGSGGGGTWYRRGAVVPPSTVCAERGPCHGKRLTCPARCFRSYSYRTKSGGGGGGGGGCTFDCTSRCVATC